MRATRCRRSTSPAPRRTRPSWSSRPPWPRSPLPVPPTGRICRRGFSPPRSSRTRSLRASSIPARRIAVISPAPTPSTRPTTCVGCSGRRRGSRPLPARLVSRRRHRRRQGPRGRRHHPRQLAQGRPRAVWISKYDTLMEDARRDWTAIGGHRSDIMPLSRSARAARSAGRASCSPPTPPCAPGEGEKAAGWTRSSTGSARLRRRHRLRRGPRHGQRRRRQRRARHKKASQQGMAGLRLQNALPTRESSTSRRPAPRPWRTWPMPRGWACGAGR